MPNFTTDRQPARRFGVHQVSFTGPTGLENPFLPRFQVTFTPPSGSPITVDAFYDGEDTWRARVYVSEVGHWLWHTSGIEGAGGTGAFDAVDSNLPGRLLPNPQNPAHWLREDGAPFLNFNDTAYHLFRASEPRWREYAADVVALGITSLRVGALGGPVWDAQPQGPRGEGTTYPWQGEDTSRYDLAKFHTSEERLLWLFETYPDLYIQLILFGQIESGKDDTGIAWAAIPPQDRHNTLRYLMARWAAFPQLFWLIVNDLFCDPPNPNNIAFMREAGRAIAQLDPWQHPLSLGPRRRMPFPFSPQDEPWVSYVHLEDQYDLNASALERYRAWGLPVFLGEDRYEHDRATRDPLDPAYMFRCLFAAWLLAGGSASYGGRWRTLTPYRQSEGEVYVTGWGGADEIAYTQALHGLDAIPHLRAFFEQRGIQLWQFRADNARVSSTDPADAAFPPKLTRRAWHELLIYHPNAAGEDRHVHADPARTATLTVDLSPSASAYLAEWFDLASGESLEGGVFLGGAPIELAAPWQGRDVLLRLLATC
jgi:hypothetical protein